MRRIAWFFHFCKDCKVRLKRSTLDSHIRCSVQPLVVLHVSEPLGRMSLNLRKWFWPCGPPSRVLGTLGSSDWPHLKDHCYKKKCHQVARRGWWWGGLGRFLRGREGVSLAEPCHSLKALHLHSCGLVSWTLGREDSSLGAGGAL